MLKSIKRKIKDSIFQISKESEMVIAEINRTSEFAIRNLKAINKNITTVSNFRMIVFEQSILKNIRDQAAYLVNGINKLGAKYSAFISLSLEEKREYVRSNWKMINVDDSELLLISENGEYLFACILNLGISQADKNQDRL